MQTELLIQLIISFILGGIENGMKQLFYKNGKLQEEGMIKNGQRDGYAKWYVASKLLSIPMEI